LLELQASDDYEVMEFSVQARQAGAGACQELPLEDLGGGRYRGTLSPSFPDN
jgi:hypothetical protein